MSENFSLNKYIYLFIPFLIIIYIHIWLSKYNYLFRSQQ